MGHCKSNPEREFYNNKILSQETRKISNKQSSFAHQETRKEQTKPKFIRRKEIKNRAEITEIETKRQ